MFSQLDEIPIMTMKYLLDASILFELFRSVPDAGVMKNLENYRFDIAIPRIVWNELTDRCSHLPDSRRNKVGGHFSKFVLLRVPILDYDKVAADWHDLELEYFKITKYTPPFVVGQVASIAAVNSLTLITKNIQEYDYFRDLQVDSWP